MILKREFWKELPPKLHMLWEEVERLRVAEKEAATEAEDGLEALASIAKKLGEDAPEGFNCVPVVIAQALKEIPAETLKTIMRFKRASSLEGGKRTLFWAEVEGLMERPMTLTVVTRANGRYGLDEKYWVESSAAFSRLTFMKLMEGLE